jgi:hypothetical protein
VRVLSRVSVTFPRSPAIVVILVVIGTRDDLRKMSNVCLK